jgi:hypothetical protein
VCEVEAHRATDAQIGYLQSLGVSPPNDLNIDDASCLIENSLNSRSIAEPWVHEIAKALKVDVSRYASKATIYDKILAALRDRDASTLAAWYVYRVYRAEINRDDPDGMRDPQSAIFKEIGGAICRDDRLLRSLMSAVETSTTSFRWFGSIQSADGTLRHGDSRRTVVYQFTSKALAASGLERSPPNPRSVSPQSRHVILRESTNPIFRDHPSEIVNIQKKKVRRFLNPFGLAFALLIFAALVLL